MLSFSDKFNHSKEIREPANKQANNQTMTYTNITNVYAAKKGVDVFSKVLLHSLYTNIAYSHLLHCVLTAQEIVRLRRV